MLTKWWKGPNSATGDEQFQNKMLKDFREFCSNQNNRLSNFWDQCWIIRDQHEQQQTNSSGPQPQEPPMTLGEGVSNGSFVSSSGFSVSSTLEEVPEKN